MNAVIFKSAQSRCIYLWNKNEVRLIDDSQGFYNVQRWGRKRPCVGFKSVDFANLAQNLHMNTDFVVTIPELKSSHLYYILAVL